MNGADERNIDWGARWRQGKIGFHEGRANEYLARYAERLGPGEQRVLVPLCGKAEDIAFLASLGHDVVGIELVEDAVVAFFEEHGLVPEVRTTSTRVRAFSAGRVTILHGDVFDCTREAVGPVTAFYDRAALVALPPDTRTRYVAHVRSLFAHRGSGLLVSFDFDDENLSPPPYPVPESEVRQLYRGATLELLDSQPVTTGRIRDAGGSPIETCFAIAL